MSAELLDKLTDELAAAVVAKVEPKLLAALSDHLARPNNDKLLSAREVAEMLGVSETTVRQLVATGAMCRCPGIAEIRIRRSVVNAYGTANALPKRK